MGIKARLETESGEALATVLDPTNVLHRLLPPAGDPRYQCLSVIDWYGNTVFNYLQAEQFQREWSEVEQAAKESDRDIVVGIRKLAEQLLQDRPLYLKFYGD